jgi:hypothetical protein
VVFCRQRPKEKNQWIQLPQTSIIILFLLIAAPINISALVRFMRLTKNVGEIKEILMAAHGIEAYETPAALGPKGQQLTQYSKGFRKI